MILPPRGMPHHQDATSLTFFRKRNFHPIATLPTWSHPFYVAGPATSLIDFCHVGLAEHPISSSHAAGRIRGAINISQPVAKHDSLRSVDSVPTIYLHGFLPVCGECQIATEFTAYLRFTARIAAAIVCVPDRFFLLAL